MRRNKKNTVLILMVMLFTIILALNASAAIKISNKKLSLRAGQSKALAIKGTDEKIKWSSSNKKIAIVLGDGVVTGIKKGTAVIKAKAAGKTLKCKVVVKAAKPGISQKKAHIYVGETLSLKVNGVKGKIVWSTSDPSVAYVKKGVVTGLKEGTVRILAKSKKKKKTYKCIVTVEKKEKKTVTIEKTVEETTQSEQTTQTEETQAEAEIIPMESIYIVLNESGDIEEGHKFKYEDFTVMGKYSNGNSEPIKDCKIKIKKVKEKTAYVASTSYGDFSAQLEIKYIPKITSITVSCKYGTVEEGHSFSTDEFTVTGIDSSGKSSNIDAGWGLKIIKNVEKSIYTASVSYDGKSATLDIPYSTEVEAIIITTTKDFGTVEENYAFDLRSDFTVKAVYKNGNEKTVIAGITCVKDTDKAVFHITATYGDKSGSIDIPYTPEDPEEGLMGGEIIQRNTFSG